MKVISISNSYPDNYMLFEPSYHFSRVREMGCELFECFDSQSVFEFGNSADVILLSAHDDLWPAFWDEISDYIKDLQTFVGIFSIDSYRNIWHRGRKPIRFDALFPSMNAIYKEYMVMLGYDCRYAFFSTCCVDVQVSNNIKDIDILVWGNNGLPSYPFRNFVVRELTRYSISESVKGELICNKLLLGSHEWSYARLPYHNLGYWGDSLYDLLGRSKISITGSGAINAPIAKYFQNAACGCVTITTDFSDRAELGFEHGKNIWITKEDSFIKDLAFLLENDDLVNEMAVNAGQLIADHHTVKIRSLQLEKFLEKMI